MNKRVLVGLIALMGGFPAGATVTVHKTMPPPLTLTIEQLCTATITATEPMRVYMKASATGAQNGKVAEVTTERFNLAVGANRFGAATLPPLKDTWISDRYKPILERTGSFPEDEWTIDLRVYAGSDSLLGSDRLVQPVRYPQVRLVNPGDGESLTAASPVFLWASTLPLPAGGEYHLTVWRADSGFTATDIINTIPWFQQRGLKTTSLRYPTAARAFEPGGKYHWQVGFVVNGYQLAASQLGSFIFSRGLSFAFAIGCTQPPETEYPKPYPDPNWDKADADRYLTLFLKWLKVITEEGSPLMQDIAAEIKEWETKKNATAKPVDIAIFFEPRASILKEVGGDISQKNGYTLQDSIDAQNQASDPSLNGYTYYYYDKSVKKYRVKVKFFSDNRRLGERFIFKWDDERGIVALMIHEFIHAKLYALQVAGAATEDLPFPDSHGGDFDKKEAELVKKFIEWVNKNNKDP